MNKLSVFIIIIFAAILTTFVTLLIPPETFAKYKLELADVLGENPDSYRFFEDVDNDGISEYFDHVAINLPNHSLDIRKDNSLIDVYVFPENERIISKRIVFSDLNNNQNKELLYLSIIENNVLLNILEYNVQKSKFQLLDKVQVDTFSYYSGEPDIVNYSILTKNDTVFFDLQAGYSVQPRNIYRFTFHDKKIIKTKRNSLANYSLKMFDYQNKTFLYAACNYASGNTISCEEHQEYLKIS